MCQVYLYLPWFCIDYGHRFFFMALVGYVIC